MSEVLNVEAIFGENVFNLGTMRERLPKNVYKEVKKVMDQGGELSLATADIVAKAMKDWAVEHGATHYTHWFQPLTGITAEKHDSFIGHPDENGRMLMEFSGKELIKGEPDASSFPSGGLRATFEARGYTAWDITSPAFLKEDATDRNRTSPFAFTGNKFEFRMVGSADSVASPNITLNAIVAEAFCEAADILEKADDFDMAVHDLIKQYLTEHHRIIFNGNGYSEEWVKEAERRGLPNIKSMIEAAGALTTERTVKLFERFHIFTKAELESREEIEYETYAKSINIEALTMIDMASKQIIPAVIKYSQKLAKTVLDVKAAGVEPVVQADLLSRVNSKLTEMKEALEVLQREEAAAFAMEDVKAQAFRYKDVVVPAMEALRAPADELEMLVDKADWPFPTYGDLMFEV